MDRFSHYGVAWFIAVVLPFAQLPTASTVLFDDPPSRDASKSLQLPQARGAVTAAATVGTSAIVTAASTPDVDITTVDVDVDSTPAAATAETLTVDEDTETPDEQQPLDADLLTEPGRVATAPVDTTDSDTIAVTWQDDTDGEALQAEIRNYVQGEWTDWVPLVVDDAPDPGSADARSDNQVQGTETIWIGDAAAVQVSFAQTPAVTADALSISFIGESPSPQAAPASTSGAAYVNQPAVYTSAPTSVGYTQPRVIPRSEWGAPAQVCTPDVASTLVGAVVHHTAGSNSYSTVAEAKRQIRQDAAYHINVRGWCDIGYNFVVDKWGNIYEGRAGSLMEPVIGVHAGGFNTGTVGVSMLGTYGSTPPNAMINAVGNIIGWRLGAYDVDPTGSMSYTTGDGQNSRYKNTTVNLKRVMGHRDVAYTACPGNGGYAALGRIRTIAKEAASQWNSPPSNLMRSAIDSTVYLLADGVRHAVSDLDTLRAFAPLGTLTYVPSAYLTAFPLGDPLTRAVRNGADQPVFIDAGKQMPFTSCDQVDEFGFDCEDLVTLSDQQSNLLPAGRSMRQIYRTTSGKAFYIIDGTKREIAHDDALAAAGISGSSITLSEGGISYLPYGEPIIRDGVSLKSRTGGITLVDTANGYLSVPTALSAVPGIPRARTTDYLDRSSIKKVEVNARVTPLLTNSENGKTYFLNYNGKIQVTDSAAVGSPNSTDPDLLAGITSKGNSQSTFVVVGDKSSTVYLIRNGKKLTIRSWADLVQLTGSNNPTILRTRTSILSLISSAGSYNPPGSLVRTSQSLTVYMLDGDSNLIRVASFATSNELGVRPLTYVSSSSISARTTSADPLTIFVSCGHTRYVALNGRLFTIRASDVTHFPDRFTSLDQTTCTNLNTTTKKVSRFWRQADGTIYYIKDGKKHQIRSWARFLQLSGSASASVPASDHALRMIPTGRPV